MSNSIKWEFHFRNFSEDKRKFAINHANCGGQPQYKGWFQCWFKRIEGNQPSGGTAVYKPDSFVVHANDWLKLIFDTLKEVLEIGLAIATEGEELKGAIQGIFDMTEDIIKAKEEKEGVLLSNLSDQAKKNFATSCDAIGRTPDEVRRIAAKMGLPSNFGILAGSAYTNAIHNATGVISGNGFKVRSGISGHNYTHYATACFISNGRLYYYWGENDTSGYWEAD